MKELHTHGGESTRSHVSDDQQRACRPAHAAFPSSTGDRSLGSLKATMVRIYTAENSKEYTWVFSSSQPPTPTPVVNYIYQHLPVCHSVGPTLSDPMDCSLPGSSVHGIL